jgi:hypothetical protein
MFEKNFKALREYIENQEYKGWDPYDGLNSKLFQSIPLLNKSRLMRLVWIQTFKRNPMNFRDLTGVKKAYNPKGLGLFLSGYCKLYQLKQSQEVRSRIHFLAHKLIELQSSGWSGSCWGYNFDWQARAFFQPKGTPSVVVSSYVANALLDAYEILKEQQLLDTAIDTQKFILNDLNRSYDGNGDFCFSYSPLDETKVFNASLLGSKLLARIFSYTREEETLQIARHSVEFCVNHQKMDGSWSYGTLPYHEWIDNFHTGFNLEALADFQKYAEENEFDESIKKGLDYYLKTFFTDEGIPKYYNNSIYPIDIHCSAQLPITLSKLGLFRKNIHQINKVLGWTVEHLQDPLGYFYFQAKKSGKVKIPYIRWAQAWMFLAFATYSLETNKKPTHEKTNYHNELSG